MAVYLVSLLVSDSIINKCSVIPREDSWEQVYFFLVQTHQPGMKWS